MGTGAWSIDAAHISIRLILAVVLGGIVGFEREQNNQAAGFRTHMLVCLGAALMMMISIYGFSIFSEFNNVRLDPSRLAAAIISGIGFLGAGAILRNGMSIRGLTTSASLWVVAGVGLSVGAGYYFAGILTSLLVLMILIAVSIVEKKYLHQKKIYKLKVRVFDQAEIIGQLTRLFTKKDIVIEKMVMKKYKSDQPQLDVSFIIHPNNKALMPALVQEIHNIGGIVGVEIE